ncbi:hypothetical protein GKJPGBOP_00004 [Streptomyces paromomycinus]|uniref:Uncharacterized protein n=2 Tax=Streptomyces paromomycinus TaxID=92743 RepID=A0A401VTD8_STREY|nr:hypothetical protein GKJPGBOP_00004 [Streptomyces paromomycinus]
MTAWASKTLVERACGLRSCTSAAGHWSAATITIPAHFFLNGWIQVLNPSEVATWLIL